MIGISCMCTYNRSLMTVKVYDPLVDQMVDPLGPPSNSFMPVNCITSLSLIPFDKNFA